MASNKFQIVVQGEASETDSDDEVYITSAPPVQSSSSGRKVPGEASETDSEDEVERARRLATENQQQMLRKDLPALVLIRNSPVSVSGQEDRSSLSRPCPDSGRFITLLQQKLQESNAQLCADVNQSLRQVYQNSARDVRQATTHLNNSQTGIINASHSIRLILDDLKSVSEKIKIITSCHLLPDITMPNPVSGQS
ncbi:biogenesis of lysosome-related organelles complex 1 subunit 3-like [Xyrauchen texanus]|uniref:biogenesis of lysosome-related organelles complex 1 subunit 3-like n=1 Tax=Xyrauchen texanus TaxID=154827 RepID=UPI00224227C9|nr:biogenesis of lysosome-related organelles complex 1 subunit 3-like [Xyrauchen texanus]